jgi:hypothetical protein
MLVGVTETSRNRVPVNTFRVALAWLENGVEPNVPDAVAVFVTLLLTTSCDLTVYVPAQVI